MVITVNTQNLIFLIYMVQRTACQFYFSRSVFCPAPHLVCFDFWKSLEKSLTNVGACSVCLFENELWVGILCCGLFASFLKAGRANAIADNSLFCKSSKHIFYLACSCVCIDLVLCCIHNGETCLQKFRCCWVLQMLQVNCFFIFFLYSSWLRCKTFVLMVDDIFVYSGFAVSEALKLGDHRLQLLCFDFFCRRGKTGCPGLFWWNLAVFRAE